MSHVAKKIPEYHRGSPQFIEMLSYIELKDHANADNSVAAAIAAAMCYIHNSHLFCQQWYECFILHLMTPDEYMADAKMIQMCIEAYNAAD